MTGKEYIEIFKENELTRSKLVRLLESQIEVLNRNGLTDNAEETKWLAIEIAEYEKVNGVVEI